MMQEEERCSTSSRVLHLEREATRQQNYALKHLKNTLTKIQQFLISAAAAVFFLSLPCSSEQKAPSALILIRLRVKTAQANALENGFDESKFKAVQGNLSDKVSGKYNVVVANIVADIIMEFNKEVGKYLENDGVYITGGIIESREDEVLLSFAQNGFEVKERFEEKGWLVFVVKKSK